MSQSFRYAAYGLTIDSALELPELGPARESTGDADVSIRIGTVSRHGTPGAGQCDQATWLDPHTFWLHVDPVAYYLVRDGCSITVMPEPDADPSELRAFLLGSASGALLLQRGFLVLHGNAIRVGDSCLVCVGDSGAGKSTLAAGFLQRGYQVLADDVVAVDESGCAIPGYPRIKLWKDAADYLGVPTEGRERIFPDWDKYNLPLEGFDPDLRLPIRWIYLLGSGDVDAVRIDPVTGMRRFRLLRDNTYRHEYLEGEALLAGHLKQCSRLASRTRLAQVTRPSEGFSLDALIDSLLADVARP